MKYGTVYEVRAIGRDYCQTEGSDHYKGKDIIEPIELMISQDMSEHFCLGSIIKYATRFKRTRNLGDLKKVSDYAHILTGVELIKRKEMIGDGRQDQSSLRRELSPQEAHPSPTTPTEHLPEPISPKTKNSR